MMFRLTYKVNLTCAFILRIGFWDPELARAWLLAVRNKHRHSYYPPYWPTFDWS